MKCKSYETFFEVFSNKTRLNIVEFLLKGPKTVNEICKAVGEEQSKVSHNLKKLMDCHFLNVKREGKKRIYSLNEETIIPLMNLVEEHVKKFCCKECTLQ
jgi:ArsR family transcriptional regulator